MLLSSCFVLLFSHLSSLLFSSPLSSSLRFSHPLFLFCSSLRFFSLRSSSLRLLLFLFAFALLRGFPFVFLFVGAFLLSWFTWRNGPSERGVGGAHNTPESFQRGNHDFRKHVLHGSVGAGSGFLGVILGLVPPSDWMRRWTLNLGDPH